MDHNHVLVAGQDGEHLHLHHDQSSPSTVKHHLEGGGGGGNGAGGGGGGGVGVVVGVGGGGGERAAFVIRQWRQSTLLYITDTLMKAVLLSAEKQKALCDELHQENADDLFNDSFQVIYMWGVIWILEYQKLLNAFDDDLEIVKGLIGACFRGEPLDDQEELSVLGPLDNMPPPPTCDDSMKYRRDWVGQLVWHSFLVMQQEIEVVVQSFPGVKGWLGNQQIDEAFVAFRRSVQRLKEMVIKNKDGLGVLRRVIIEGVVLEGKIGGGGGGGAGDGGGGGGGDGGGGGRVD